VDYKTVNIDIGKYEALYAAGSQCEDPDTPYAKYVLNQLDPWKPTKILDVGCGTGVHTEWFNDNGYECIGITIEEWEIERKVHSNVQFGNIYNIPFGEKQFDLVFCLGTLEHIFVPFIAMCEFNRVLVPGGYLFIDTPNLAGNYVFNEGYYYHKSILFPIHMKDLFMRTKFEMVDGKENGGLINRYTEEIIYNPDDGTASQYQASGLGIYLVKKVEDFIV
jgi:SAM-dependent methyltransferase